MRPPIFPALVALLAVSLVESATAQTATYLDSLAMPPAPGNPAASQPMGVALDPATGGLFVTDYEFTHSRVVHFLADGTSDFQFGIKGTGNAQFENPTGIAINSAAGRSYVSDYANSRVQVFDLTGGWISTLTNPNGNVGQGFSLPVGLAVLPGTGSLYAADGNRVQRLNVNGVYQGQWGNFGSGDSQFGNSGPAGVAANQTTGQIYVVDTSNTRVEGFDAGGFYQNSFGAPGSGDGQFLSARYVAVDAAGHVYVTDNGNDRVSRFSADGVFQFSFGAPGSGDGQFDGAQGIAVSASGIVYVADQNNGRIQRWQITEPVAPPAAPNLSVSGKKKLTVTSGKVAIKGTATGLVTSVTYAVGSKKGTASGTTAWKFNAALKPGKNVIRITAHGPGGDSAPTTITVTRK